MEDVNRFPCAKLCRVIKGSSGNYGFTVKLCKDISMEIINRVAMGSPAQLAGLENGDRIFSVNGVSIIGMAHHQTVDLIRKHPNHFVCMVVTKSEHEKWKQFNRQPNEWEAIPYWKKHYGQFGIPRNYHIDKKNPNCMVFIWHRK